MSALTTWGYTLTDIDTIPEMLSLEEFYEVTAGKYAEDSRVEYSVAAAESAIRNYCGWHVSPSMACELNTTLYDKAISITDRVLMIQLPATFVSSIESITIGDEVYDETYVLMPNGILRVFGLSWSHLKLWTPVVIRYTAGLPAGASAGVKALVAGRAAHALASTEGIQSETAGGISVTYNSTWANGAKATALADDAKEALSPYRLRGVF